jgi:hypothetical protein
MSQGIMGLPSSLKELTAHYKKRLTYTPPVSCKLPNLYGTFDPYEKIYWERYRRCERLKVSTFNLKSKGFEIAHRVRGSETV